MRVKIGDTWLDANDQPLAVQFTDDELACINQMTPGDGLQNSFAAGRIAAVKPGEVDPMLVWLREGREEVKR